MAGGVKDDDGGGGGERYYDTAEDGYSNNEEKPYKKNSSRIKDRMYTLYRHLHNTIHRAQAQQEHTMDIIYSITLSPNDI